MNLIVTRDLFPKFLADGENSRAYKLFICFDVWAKSYDAFMVLHFLQPLNLSKSCIWIYLANQNKLFYCGSSNGNDAIKKMTRKMQWHIFCWSVMILISIHPFITCYSKTPVNPCCSSFELCCLIPPITALITYPWSMN